MCKITLHFCFRARRSCIKFSHGTLFGAQVDCLSGLGVCMFSCSHGFPPITKNAEQIALCPSPGHGWALSLGPGCRWCGCTAPGCPGRKDSWMGIKADAKFSSGHWHTCVCACVCWLIYRQWLRDWRVHWKFQADFCLTNTVITPILQGLKLQSFKLYMLQKLCLCNLKIYLRALVWVQIIIMVQDVFLFDK